MAKTYSEDYLVQNKGTIFTAEGANASVEVKKVSRKRDEYVIILHSAMATGFAEAIFRGSLTDCRRVYPALRKRYRLEK